MSFLLDDGKAVLTGDALLVNTCGIILPDGGSAESLYDSVFTKLFKLPDECVVLPGHDFGGGTHSTIGEEKEKKIARCGMTKKEFIEYVNLTARDLPCTSKLTNITKACNMKDGAKPFYVRSLRTRVKHRWGIFG